METVDADNESTGNIDDDADDVAATVGSPEKPEATATRGEAMGTTFDVIDDRLGEEGRRNIVDMWLCVQAAVGVTALAFIA